MVKLILVMLSFSCLTHRYYIQKYKYCNVSLYRCNLDPLSGYYGVSMFLILSYIVTCLIHFSVITPNFQNTASVVFAVMFLPNVSKYVTM